MHTTIDVQAVSVPAVGLGTWQLTGRACVKAVSDALALGYRHIDTARGYRNERKVGKGIRASGVPREEIFLVTKVPKAEAAPDRLRASCEASLADLGVDHIDLLLLHWPAPRVPLADTLHAMAELRDEGRIAHFGVSNFPPPMLEEALELGPVLNDQVEFHPYLHQDELIAMADDRDVLVTAYSPLDKGRVARDPVLQEIGAAHGKTPGQVALRWLLDHPKTCVVPRTSSHERRVENLDVFDFELDDDERARIDALAASGDGGRASAPRGAGAGAGPPAP
jgi:diketogulonate reductase-like aldo/keto reductase